ncbi:hypothetical protein CRYUN_Cryun27aG0052800 [Craigia yunnanensis]
MVLSLGSIMSGSSKFPSPKQIQKDQCTASTYKQYLQLPGLKTLIYAQESASQTQSPTHQLNPLIIHSYTIPQSSPPSSSLSSSDFQSLFRSLSTHSSSYSSCSSGMDDILGTESGVYMSPNALKMPEMDQKAYGFNYGKKKRGRAMTGEYPPAIPLLARTGNLPGHMPWILARHYSNGRLVLKEEKVKHHEYFEVYRENGRLIIDLVPLDDTFRCCHVVCEENDDEEEIELENLEFLREELERVEEYDEETEAAAADNDDDDEDNGYVYQGSITISSAFSVPKFYHGNERYGDPRKCLTYSGWSISESSSIFSNAIEEEGSSTPMTFCNIIPPITTTTACDVACLVK